MTRPRAVRTPRAVVVVLCSCICAAVGLSTAASLGAQRSSRTHAMYVSVVDRDGAPVSDLKPSDLVIKEDNVTREILRMSPADDPMQIAVLVDTSQAARNQIAFFRTALPPFVEKVTTPNGAGNRNEVAIIGLGERPTILASYSSNPAAVKQGIDRIWALQSSGMYMLDAVVEVAQGLKKRHATRPVVVTIATAGIDYSTRQHDQAIEPLKDIGAAFYALSMGQPDTSLSFEARERSLLLDLGPRETGGYQQQILAGQSLESRLQQLGLQLTHQYRIEYARPESLIPPEKITVSAVNPALAARGTPIKDTQAPTK